MSFTKAIKNEILDRVTSYENFKELLNGFIFITNTREKNSIACKINNKQIQERILNFCLKYGVQSQIQNDLLIFPNWILTLNKIKNYSWFFAGIFLGRGSMNSLQAKSNHLEFFCHNAKDLEFLIQLLNKDKYSFNFKTLSRLNKYVAYIKTIDDINDFLKLINVKNNLMIFLEKNIEKDINSYVSKQANLDWINSQKIVKSSKDHLKMLQYIYDHKLEDQFNDQQLLFFSLKYSEPFQSLQTLREILAEKQINISRSGLHHWIRKLRKVYILHHGK